MTTTTKTTRALAAREDPPWEWRQAAFRAMNTDIHLSLLAPQPQSLLRLVEESFRYFEQLLSRFRPASELCRMNDCPESLFRASPDFFAAVEAALWAAQQTDGIYDPTILPYLEKAGYDCTFDAVANQRPLLPQDKEGVGLPASGAAGSPRLKELDYRHLSLDRFARLIVRPPGLRLDLGGMGKGWTVDRVVDELCTKGHFLLNAGGDLYAYGSPGPERGWEVNLSHPLRPELNFATLLVDQQAVATSTIARRRWLKKGVAQHHLIDPRTGRPAETDAISASVVGGRVFTAEIYAKTALILGIEEGLSFLESLADAEAALFSASGEVHLTTGMDRYLQRLDPSGC